MVLALAAALFLGEGFGWKRLVAIVIGFIGVMLIVRPGAEGFTIYSIYGLIAVCFVTHWIFFSWWLGPAIHSGGEAISGRFMVPIIPLLLMAAPGFNEARAAWRTISSAARICA